MDVFKEMDEIFCHLFPEWDEDFGMAASGFSGMVPARQEYRSCEGPGMPNVSGTETGTAEPVPETITHPHGITVAVELPGVTEENLNLAVRGPALLIEAVSLDTVYVTRVPLPPDTDPATIRHSLKNGVLEVSFGKRAGTE